MEPYCEELHMLCIGCSLSRPVSSSLHFNILRTHTINHVTSTMHETVWKRYMLIDWCVSIWKYDIHYPKWLSMMFKVSQGHWQRIQFMVVMNCLQPVHSESDTLIDSWLFIWTLNDDPYWLMIYHLAKKTEYYTLSHSVDPGTHIPLQPYRGWEVKNVWYWEVHLHGYLLHQGH